MQPIQYSDSRMYMKSPLDVCFFLDANRANEASLIFNAVYREADRIINIISAWQEGTEVQKINRNAGIQPVNVSDELYGLLKRAVHVSKLTMGLFDITFASIDKLWYYDRPMESLPSDESIRHSIRNINYEYIQLNDTDRSVYITNKGTKIELGATGKGYVTAKMQALLINTFGITSGLINAGGDLVCWGKKADDSDWKIGVADPNNKKKQLAVIPVHNKAIATSGNYERFATFNGKKYSHIIHPKTGYPVKGISSVTVISPDAEMSDAIATSLFLMGVEDGLRFINQFNDIQCFIIDDYHQYHFSENLKPKHITHSSFENKSICTSHFLN
jgi:thiamine biosynthesis lipoprotein